MKRLLWFTKTNINYINRGNVLTSWADKTIDLSSFIELFIKEKLWEKSSYRDEYTTKFTQEDLESIKSIKIHIHNKGGPFSNQHNYESLIANYIGEKNINREKIIASGIGEAAKIAVVDVNYESKDNIIKTLSYEEEKDIDLVFENLGGGNIDTWHNQNRLKSAICEFIQFCLFTLHLNFLTEDYRFNFSSKPTPTGLSVISENEKYYFEDDKIELLSHYILIEDRLDKLDEIMSATSKFWCKYFSSIHFFLDALKGTYMTSTNFTKLVFTFESFFSKNISNDYMTLVAPILISKNVSEMKKHRASLRKCFSLRNEIVHGNNIHNMIENKEMSKLFFELKNLITLIFFFLINNKMFLGMENPKLNHELIFRLLPKGLN
ncbi:hypothetical protein [Tenacibaculum insulae]|uniref:hypothetical protein n=1 Tax=Tenacibaculum insulae TaxID=2029677 RepID=UPI003AB4BE9A